MACVPPCWRNAVGERGWKNSMRNASVPTLHSKSTSCIVEYMTATVIWYPCLCAPSGFFEIRHCFRREEVSQMRKASTVRGEKFQRMDYVRTYGWTRKQVGHKHMETQMNVFGFLTDIPVNSWLPFLQMINFLRLGRSFSSITDEILAGHGNIARQTLAKWPFQMAGCLSESFGVCSHQLGRSHDRRQTPCSGYG